MKNKRLLAILLVFVFLGLAAVSSALIFRVQTVNIVFRNEPEYIIHIRPEQEAIADYGKQVKFVNGKSILFGVDREKMEAKIEESDPFIRVTNIEARFPNKLVVSVRERYAMYSFEYGGRTAILDATMRIVSDEPSHFVRPDDQGLISISGQLNVNEDFSEFTPGEDIMQYCESDKDTLRVQTLILMSQLFASQKLFEDALNHLFSSIVFENTGGQSDNMILTLRRSYYDDAEALGLIIIEIRDIKELYAKKLAVAWEILQKYSGYQPGRVLVETGTETPVSGKWLPEG